MAKGLSLGFTLGVSAVHSSKLRNTSVVWLHSIREHRCSCAGSLNSKLLARVRAGLAWENHNRTPESHSGWAR
jgi:hypothetical protein